jgi:adenylate cyclase
MAFGVLAQWALAHGGVWYASALPIVALGVTFAATSLYRQRVLESERSHVRRAFERYLAAPMVDRVIENPSLPELGGELRDISVLFCDLHGFTSLAERLAPEQVARVTNDFLSAATDAIVECGGTVDKYIGDAVMALWNAPLDQPDHPTLACRAALRILERIDDMNRSRAATGNAARLAVGIGINTGTCTVGNFGSQRRFDYSAVGDVVNIAARLQSETANYDVPVLVGPETAARASGVATLRMPSMQLRGRTQMLDVFTLAIHARGGPPDFTAKPESTS